MLNAHQYANKFGCEVRATEGGSNAAANHAPFHIFKYYDTSDLIAYTDIDWQNASFVIHDERIDKRRRVPAGSTPTPRTVLLPA